MERIKNLNLYQKITLIIMVIMTLIFIPIYSMTIERVGYEYHNAILVPEKTDDATVYTGKIKGKQASFTVSSDRQVRFQYGDKLYGPYVVKNDPTIVIKDMELDLEDMKRFELYLGEEKIFRGAAIKSNDYWVIFKEDGGMENIQFRFTSLDGVVTDEEGNVIDSMEPSISNVLDLIYGPKLVHKGEWYIWFYGMIVCVITAVSIFFADELFRFHLAFRINDVDRAEPSDWEIAGRYISWTVLPVMALVIFILGISTGF